MTINNNSVVNNQTLQNDNLSGYNSSAPPTVSGIYLVKGGSLESAVGLANADPGTNIYIHFSEAMDNTTITAITSGTSCSGTFRFSSDNFTSCLPMSSSPAVANNTNKNFTFEPATAVTNGRTYRIIVTTGVKDGSGISMGANNSTVSGDNGFTVRK